MRVLHHHSPIPVYLYTYSIMWMCCRVLVIKSFANLPKRWQPKSRLLDNITGVPPLNRTDQNNSI